ncbi:MAG TPA: methyltransferase domain-containing protein [Candidatus Acidoferrum sp.]|jgi:trans-aconitate methyltransferase
MAEGAKWDAELYDEKHSFVWKMAAGLLELLEAKSGERILDVGCGTGHLTAKIAANGAQVTGVDQSAEMIQQARAAYPALRFEVMDARQLTFPEKFDAVFSNATLHWIKQPEQAVECIAWVLRPGGRFVAEFGGKGNTAGLMATVARAWAKAGLPPPMPNPWYYPSLAEYAGLLEKHGLEVTYGLLFDRPTPLEDGEQGLRNWLEMFGGALMGNLPKEQKDRLLEEIQNEARTTLYSDGRWVLDYRRLRILARKT